MEGSLGRGARLNGAPSASRVVLGRGSFYPFGDRGTGPAAIAVDPVVIRLPPIRTASCAVGRARPRPAGGGACDEGAHVHEAGLLALDSLKAPIDLGWRGRLRFHDALAWTVVWGKRGPCW